MLHRWLLFLLLLLPMTLMAAQQKAGLIYLKLDPCPQCEAFEQQVLSDRKVQRQLSEHFTLVTHLTGQAELSLPGGARVNEAEFLRRLNIYGAPALVFFNQQGETVLVQQGRLLQQDFIQAMNYVQTNAYESVPFSIWRVQNP